MLKAGVAGFKCFLINSGVPEFPHVSVIDLHTAMSELQGTNSVLLVSDNNSVLYDFIPFTTRKAKQPINYG